MHCLLRKHSYTNLRTFLTSWYKSILDFLHKSTAKFAFLPHFGNFGQSVSLPVAQLVSLCIQHAGPQQDILTTVSYIPINFGLEI